jgi:hypothetical protein
MTSFQGRAKINRRYAAEEAAFITQRPSTPGMPRDISESHSDGCVSPRDTVRRNQRHAASKIPGTLPENSFYDDVHADSEYIALL